MTTLTIVLPDWAYFGIAALLAMNLAVNAMLLYFKRKLPAPPTGEAG